MLKALLIIAGVLAVIVGGVLYLRSSSRVGMPSEDVVRRVKERERQLRSEQSGHED